MALSPSDRIKLIAEVARRLSEESWPLIDLTLKQFDLPWTDSWSGEKDSYIFEMLTNASDDSLLQIGHHVGFEVDSPKIGLDPPFWNAGDLRVFISHLATHRQYAGELKESLAKFGFTSFVAHTDINPTAEWQSEIETALSTCEVLIALLHDGFSGSDWTDQEVGFAMGRRLPAFSVRFDQAPYGFIGRFQAFNGNGKSTDSLAQEIFDALRSHKETHRRMSELIVSRFENSLSFANAKANMKLLEELEHWSKRYSNRIEKALESNSQINGSWGVAERVATLVKRWDVKGV